MRYKRFLVAFILLLISVSTSLFAYYIEYKQAQMTSVDLSNDSVGNYLCLDNHNASEELEDEFRLNYSENQVIARIILEDTDLSNGGIITFDFDGFNFNCDGFENINRPYGIELVFWQKWKIDGSPKDYIVAGYKAFGTGHLDDASDTDSSFEIPAGASKESIATIIKNNRDLRRAYFWYRILFPTYWIKPLDDFIDYIVEKEETYLEEGYIDVVLVLPELTFEQENQMVYSDEYSASFTVNGTKPIEFTGYYKKNNNPLTFNLTVDGNENTKAIDLSSESIKSDEAGLEIGSYEYSAEFINDLYNEPNLKYYSFVSSSDSPSGPNGEFVLVDTIDNQNTIRYQIGLKNGSNPIKWYTGDMSVSLGENVSNEVDGLLAGPASYKVLDNKIIIEDSGVILFKLTESADNPFEIPPGTYNSNIYFHVIANL